MNLNEAVAWLICNAYFEENQLGFMRAIKPPKRGDLDQYVLALRVLNTNTMGNNPRVSVSCGSDRFDLRYKVGK